MKYSVGTLLLVGWMSLFYLFVGGSFSDLLNFARNIPNHFSFIIVVAAIIFMTSKFRFFMIGVKVLFFKKQEITESDCLKSSQLFKLLEKTIFYASIIYSTAGFTAFFMGISPSAIQADLIIFFGINIAHSLNPILHGAVINLLFINPIIHKLELLISK